MAVVVAEDLTKTFRRPKKASGLGGALRHLVRPEHDEHVAVDRLSLSVEAGEAVAYVGPNGAGKSTTVKMLTGILVPTSGSVRVGGLVPHEQRVANARQVGVVFGQRTQLWWDLPVRDSLELLRDMYGIGPAEYARTIEEFDAVLGLGELLGQVARKLSLGQRMRADLAAALLHRPPIVFLDEPTIGLDLEVKDRVRAFVRGMVADGTTVLLTTHDLGDISDICTRIVIIDHGSIVFDGPLATVTDAFATEGLVRVTLREAPTSLGPLRTALPDADVAELDGNELVVRFDRRAATGGEILRPVFDLHDVVDVRIEEPDIETVVRKMYARDL